MLSFLLIFFASGVPTFSADISLKYIDIVVGASVNQKEKVGVITLSGDIIEGDYDAYVTMYEVINSKNIRVIGIELKSNGGLVSEAMRIGRHVRKHRLMTVISSVGSEGQPCYSSCALIYFSGLHRGSTGKLGIHRTYFKNTDGMSFSQMESALGSNHKKVTDFLKEMRVSGNIIEELLSTSSTTIKLIEKRSHDRLFDEYLIGNCGKEPIKPPQATTYAQHEAYKKAYPKYLDALSRFSKCKTKVIKTMQSEVQF